MMVQNNEEFFLEIDCMLAPHFIDGLEEITFLQDIKCFVQIVIQLSFRNV